MSAEKKYKKDDDDAVMFDELPGRRSMMSRNVAPLVLCFFLLKKKTCNLEIDKQTTLKICFTSRTAAIAETNSCQHAPTGHTVDEFFWFFLLI